MTRSEPDQTSDMQPAGLRRWCLLLVSVLITMAIVGCQVTLPLPAEPTVAPESNDATPTPTPAPAELDPSGQSLLLWHSLDGEVAATWEDLVKQFNQENEWDIEVALEQVRDEEELQRRLLAAVQAGDPPSLFVGSRATYGALLSADGLPDVHALVSDEAWALAPATRDALMLNLFPAGKLVDDAGAVRVPLGNDLYVLLYNSDQLARIGDDGPPDTLGDFESSCREYQSQFSQRCIAVVPRAESVLNLAWAFGGAGVTSDGRLVTEDEGLHDAFTFLRGLADSGFVKAMSDEADGVEEVIDGETLFSIASTADLPLAADSSNLSHYGVAPLPYGSDGPVLAASSTLLSVLDPVPERQVAAWLFVRWYLSTPTVQSEFAQQTSLVPVHHDAIVALENDDDTGFILRQVLPWLSQTRALPASPAWFGVAPALERVAVDVLNRKLGPDAALLQLAEEQ